MDGWHFDFCRIGNAGYGSFRSFKNGHYGCRHDRCTGVFYDNDLNGVYSTGDYGLSEVTVCIQSVFADSANGKKLSCVGTDYGDTWWEDLKHGPYQVRVVPSTLPEGVSLNSILRK